MHHTYALEIAKLGANVIIGENSGLHHTHAIEIIRIVVSKGNKIIIEKDYHYSHIAEMVRIGGDNLTVKI